jgi:hypothetical protein
MSCGWVVVVFLLGLATRAPALPYEGSLSLQIGTLPPLPVLGSGDTASGPAGTPISLTAGAFALTELFLPIPQLRTGPGDVPTSMDDDFMGTGTLLPINREAFGTNPAVTMSGLGATAASATTFLAANVNKQGVARVIYPANPIVALTLADVANGAGTFSAAGATSGAAYGVQVSGGGLGGLVAVSGASIVGLFNTAPDPAYPPQPFQPLTVPLTVIGGALGGNLTVMGAVNVTVTGAPWSTGSVFVLAGPGTAETPGGAPGFETTITTPGGLTTVTVVTRVGRSGFDARTAGGLGTVQLVSPVSIKTNVSGSDQIPSFAIISLNFVPEPTTALLVAGGLLALGLRGARRRS